MQVSSTLHFKDFSTLFFPPTCHAHKTWFELSRSKLYRNDVDRNKNYFELAEVQVTEGKITVNV